MTQRVILCFMFATFTAYCPALQAGLVSASGAVTVISAPASVAAGALTSTTTTWLFQERANFALPENVGVNISLPGTSPTDTGKNFSHTQLLAGTQVDSYFLHVNLPRDYEGVLVLRGTLTFDHDILGIVVGNGLLNPSDLVVGHPGTEYPTPPADYRGWEFGFGDGAAPNTIDEITLSEDRRTIDFKSRTGTIDQFRVITAVPEPSSVVLLAAGGLGILAAFRRSRRD